MQVADLIKVLEATLSHLKQMDANLPVAGHISCPQEGYGGDLEDPITKITPQEEEGQVVVYIHY